VTVFFIEESITLCLMKGKQFCSSVKCKLTVFSILYGIGHHEFNTQEQTLHTSIQTFYVQRMIHSTKNLRSGALESGCFTATIPMFTLLCLCRNFWPIMTRLFPCNPYIPQIWLPLTSFS